jgi:tetratricopeptide (TPR) repeat protein
LRPGSKRLEPVALVRGPRTLTRIIWPRIFSLAEIAGREQQWNEVLALTGRALELDPVNDAYAYFFSAIAYFNLNQVPEAEKRALKAEEIDRDSREPLVQFLLAQFYEAKPRLSDCCFSPSAISKSQSGFTGFR